MSIAAYESLASQMGLDENAQHAALSDYLTTGGVNLDPAVAAWCAGAVNAALEHSGGKGTGSNMARSFMNWGQPVDQPQKGDIAVFSRGTGPQGHVGFFDGYNPDGSIRVLGGNQGNKVQVSSFSPDRLLGFRRDAAPQPQQQPQNALAAPQQQPQMNFQVAQLDPAQFMSRRNALQPTVLPWQNTLGRL